MAEQQAEQQTGEQLDRESDNATALGAAILPWSLSKGAGQRYSGAASSCRSIAFPVASPLPPPPAPPNRERPLRWLLSRRVLWRRVLGSAAAAAALLTALALFLPDRRSAWDQAALTRGQRPPEDPVTLSLWANELAPLLREAEALGSIPRQREPLVRWLEAQCGITLRLQALQRRYGKRVETASEMGRPPYCEDLPQVRRAFTAAHKP